jgi:cyclase
MEDLRFVELADGVHTLVSPHLMSNCTIVATAEGVLTVDAPYTRPLCEAVIAHARRLSPQPIRWVVSSHHHGDHTLHLEAFAPPAQVIGHVENRACVLDTAEYERQRFMGHYPEAGYESVTITPPSLTYTDRLTLYLGEREIHLWHPGPAHTAGDTVLFLPAERLAVVADLLFNGVHPVARNASIGGWIAALDALRGMDLATVVPGHGPIASRRELGVMRDYLLALREAVQPYARSGAPLERALAEIRLEAYAAWPGAERLGPAIERTYAELAASVG